jgi:hypothetical protein
MMTQKAKQPPGLELVSKQIPITPSVELENQLERRRRPRLSLTGEQFRMSANGKVYSVSDLSAEGMALRVLNSDDLLLFPVAMEIQGVLNLKGQRVPVRAKVRHVGREMIGCEFQGLEPETKTIIGQFLRPEVLARELRPIPSSEMGALWYHGPSGTDLLFWRGLDGQYHRLAFYLCGNFIQWDQQEGLVTGTVQGSQSAGEEHGVVRFDTMVIQKDSSPDVNKLDIAKVLVLSSNLPEDMKRWCVRQLLI